MLKGIWGKRELAFPELVELVANLLATPSWTPLGSRR